VEKNEVDLQTRSITGAAHVRMMEKFNELYNNHPVGPDMVTRVVGRFIAPLVLISRVVSEQVKLQPTAEHAIDTFDYGAGVGWALTVLAMVSEEIILSAFCEANITPGMRKWIDDSLKEKSAGAPAWPIFQYMMLVGGRDACHFATALMNELCLRFDEACDQAKTAMVEGASK
jgi:hypothetical protein